MGGWRGDRGSYVVSPTPPVSPLGKGRARGGEGGGGGEGPKGQGQGAGMGAFRVEPGSKSRGSRLRIRSPFRKKEKEEVRRSFIFAFEEQPPEKILREAEGGLVLNEEYTAMIEKKEKQLLNEVEEVETVEDVEEGDCQGDDHLLEVDTEDTDAHDFAKNRNFEIRDPENKNDDEQDEMALCLQSRSFVVSEDNDVDDEVEEDYNIALEDNEAREGKSCDKGIDNYCIKNEDNDVESVESSAISVDTAREVLEGVIEGEDMMAETDKVEVQVEVEVEVEDKVEVEVEDEQVNRQENQPNKEESREGTERDEISQVVSDGPRKDGEGGQGGECGQVGEGGEEEDGDEEVGLGVQLLSPQHRGKLDGPGGNDNRVIII